VSGDVSLNVVVDSGEIDVVVDEFSVSLDVEESVVAALLVSGPVGPAGPQGPAGSVFSGVAWWYGVALLQRLSVRSREIFTWTW